MEQLKRVQSANTSNSTNKNSTNTTTTTKFDVKNSNNNTVKKISEPKIRERSQSGNKIRAPLYKSNNIQIVNEEDNDFIEFIPKNKINTQQNIVINSTKVEKQINTQTPTKTYSNKTNFIFDDEEYNRKLKVLEDNLLVTNVTKDKFQIKDEENKFTNKNKIESFPELDENENYSIMNNDLIKKFDNLTDLEEGMKKLNEILDNSNKNSLKFKVNYEKEDSFAFENESKIDNSNSYFRQESLLYDDEKEPTPYKNDQNLYTHKEDILNKNFPNKFQNAPPVNPNLIINKPKSIEINKMRKVIDVDAQNNFNNFNYENFDNNKTRKDFFYTNNTNNSLNEQDENLDYLKELLIKTKIDIDNHNKNFDTGNTTNKIPKNNYNSYNNNAGINNFDEDDEPKPYYNIYK